MYVARSLDMFVSVRALTIKSTISTFVEVEELGMLTHIIGSIMIYVCVVDHNSYIAVLYLMFAGRIFSIIGILEAFGKFVFVSWYSIIYEETLETWPSAFYMCSFVCLVVTAVLFM